MNVNPIKIARSGLRLRRASRGSHQIAREPLHLLTARRVLADHQLGKFASFFRLQLCLYEFGDFDLIATFTIHTGSDLLVGRRSPLATLSRLSLIVALCVLRESDAA